MKEMIKLFLEDIPFYVSSESIKTFILNEIKRLEKVSGYSTKNIPIEFHHTNTSNKSDKNIIAFFQHRGNQPVRFCFFIDKLNNTSPNKILDVCRHEFAHYITFMQHLGNQPKDCHGPEWKKVCVALDAKPLSYMDLSHTKHFNTTQ